MRPSGRAVSRGSSASAVPMPTTTASTDARHRWASSRLASPLIHCESPVRVATLPSSVIADLNSTHGRPTRACLRNAWFSSRALVASSPSASTTSTPSSRRIPRPRPAAFSVGSSEPTTTRLIPACTIASVHGGVLPSWQQGSSDTYSVASLRSARPHASIALTSACAAPNRSCQPSPSTSPVAGDHRADDRVRLDHAPAVARQLDRARQVLLVGVRAGGHLCIQDNPARPGTCRGWESRACSAPRTAPAVQPVDRHLRPRAVVGERVVVEAPVEVERDRRPARGA